MKFTLSYSPYADADLEESLIFYGMRGENLTQRFLSEIQDAIESILGSPLSFPILFKKARKIAQYISIPDYLRD